MPPTSPSGGWLEARRARREGENRSQQWAQMRSTGTGPVYPTLSGRPAPAPAPVPAAPDTWMARAGTVLLPPIAAVLLAATLAASLPALSGELRVGFLLLGLVLTGAVGYGAYRAWSATHDSRWLKVIGGTLAGLLAAGLLVGSVTQVVVDGRPQLAGSAPEQTFRISQHLAATAEVLTENQKLLRLPDEQSKSLLALFDAAIAQDASIAAAWNPAVAGELPTPALGAAYAAINAAATRQGEALAARKQNLLDPDPQVAANVASLYQQVEAVLGNGPGSITQAIADAYHEVGLRAGQHE